MDSPRLHGGEVLQMSESGERANEREERLPEGPQALYRRGELGLAWTSSDAIGRRGRCAGMASCAKSRGQVGCVGGWLFRLWHGRFQRGCGRNGVTRGPVGARQCRARVASRLQVDAMQVRVLSGAG
jgi:hypothetical protein